jgi:membrane protein YdbS with pleckstrin-like domain
MSARYLLLLIIVLYVVFALFVPAMQNIFGYGFGTLIALVVLWYVFFANRGRSTL